MADLRIASASMTPVGPAGSLGLRPATFPELHPRSEGFGDSLGRALADVNALQLKAQEAASGFALGESVDTAQSLVTIEKANISFQFAMQIRNKLLEAYQEIMRIQV